MGNTFSCSLSCMDKANAIDDGLENDLRCLTRAQQAPLIMNAIAAIPFKKSTEIEGEVFTISPSSFSTHKYFGSLNFEELYQDQLLTIAEGCMNLKTF